MAAPTLPRDRSPERLNSPPPLQHTVSQPILPHMVPLPPAAPQHSQSQSSVLSRVMTDPHHPRPVNRVPPPNFISQYRTVDDEWQVTDELMAEIERADYQAAQGQLSHPAGTSGVAYAGGAASSGAGLQHQLTMNTAAKDPAVERVRATDRSSPKDQDSSGPPAVAKRQTRDRAQTVSSQLPVHDTNGANRTPEYRGSPQYATPMSSPNERSAGYTQYVPEGYQAGNSQGPTPPALRKASGQVGVVPNQVAAEPRSTPPAASKLASHTPPLQAMTQRPPDRSLPVQEEPEEDHDRDDHDNRQYDDTRGTPSPASDVYPDGSRFDVLREHAAKTVHTTTDDDEETLNEEDDDHHHRSKSGEESDAGFTPRSPSTTLPERPRDAPYAAGGGQYMPSGGQYVQPSTEYQKTVRAKHRSGSTDQLGMRTFDPAMFEHTVNSLRSDDAPVNGQRQQQSPPQQQHSPPQPPLPPQVQSQSLPPPQTQAQQQIQHQMESQMQQMDNSRHYGSNHVQDQRMTYPGMPHPGDMQGLIDDSTSVYLRAYLQSPSSRPNAPIPPTPQSQTAAPSPIISAQSELEHRQIGSPYPYPFTHIRRTTVAAPTQAPSSSYDLNDPAVIREQLALQMQIYALNNGLATPTDSTFSPSSTPFPGPGYNPWAFIPTMAGHPNMGGGSAMSIRSSPSHEPVHLPPPPLAMRGRGLRRRDQTVNLRQQGGRDTRRVKPPPRVESTQPRETSPEPSSGEETAGEERFVDQYVREGEEVDWAHVRGHENGHGNGNGNGNGIEIENGEVADNPDDEGDWVDEDEDGEEEDLLDLEFHPTFVSNPQKRRRRWETRWDAVTQSFQSLDRETDATLILLASPAHSSKLYALTSRSIRRDSALLNSSKLTAIRTSFNHLASQRRVARSQRISLFDRLHLSSPSIRGSPGSGDSREDDLRRALEAALGSLGEMGKIYEQRETRWRDELRQLSEDRDKVELLLHQALGPSGLTNGNGHTDDTNDLVVLQSSRLLQPTDL
ncbi:hypothetical protein BKA93DRAFT_826126 [Sparassis latifolia]